MPALKSFSDGPFFGPLRWTQIDWEQRQRLRGKPLASWLHSFYASHAEPRALTALDPRFVQIGPQSPQNGPKWASWAG